MKFKRTLLKASSVLALVTAGAVPVISSIVMPQSFGQVQAQEADLTEEEQNTVAVIKDNVAGFEPVNLEQLLNVSDRDLLEYHTNAQTEADVWQAVYNQIAENYPELNLLQGEDYDAYFRAADAIAQRSDYTFSDLNMALPRNTLSIYRTAMANNEDNVDLAVAEVLPMIDDEVEAYIQRREERQNADESESGDDSEAINNLHQELINGTPMLQSQLDQIDDVALLALSEELNELGGDISTLYNRLLEDYSEIFASESNRMRQSLVTDHNLNPTELDAVSDSDLFWEEYAIYREEGVENFERLAEVMVNDYNVSREEDDAESAENLRNELLNGTPMTQAQLDQFDDATLLALADEINDEGGDPSALFNRLVEDYPQAFAEELSRIRTALVNDYNLNETELDAVANTVILWENLMIVNEEGSENFESLADAMVTKYEVTREEDESGDDQAAENLRNELINGTPMTQAQLDQFDDATLLTLADEINEEGGDPSTLFNRLVVDYPEVFADEVTRIRTALVNDHNLNETELDAIEDTVILWENLTVVNDEGSENFESLADAMVTKYEVTRDEDESGDDQAAENLRNELINGTPMTQSQLEQFTDETLVNLADELNQEGGDIATLYNRLVADYPQVFEAESVRMRNQLVNRYGLDEAALANISNADLFWHELAVFNDNNQTENFAALAELLVAEYNIPRESSSESDESQEESSSVEVSKESSIESNESIVSESGDLLPATGETSSTWLIILSLVLLGGAGFLIYRGRQQSKQ